MSQNSAVNRLPHRRISCARRIFPYDVRRGGSPGRTQSQMPSAEPSAAADRGQLPEAHAPHRPHRYTTSCLPRSPERLPAPATSASWASAGVGPSAHPRQNVITVVEEDFACRASFVTGDRRAWQRARCPQHASSASTPSARQCCGANAGGERRSAELYGATSIPANLEPVTVRVAAMHRDGPRSEAVHHDRHLRS